MEPQTDNLQQLQEHLDTAIARIDQIGGDLGAEVQATLRILDLDISRLHAIADALAARAAQEVPL